MVFNLVFANNTFLSCVFFFFLIIDLYFFIPVNIAQILNSTVEIKFPTAPKSEIVFRSVH